MYTNWINALLGLVVIGAIFMDLSTNTLMWTLGIAGAIITATSLWRLIAEQGTTKDSFIEHGV